MRESTNCRILAGISIALALAIYVLIPSQVTSEPIPGTGDYVTITPVLFPMMCAIAFAFLGALFVLQSFFLIEATEVVPDTAISREGKIHLVTTALILMFYSVLLEELGYIVITIFVLLYLNLYFGNRDVRRLVLGVIVVPVALYYFFGHVLLVPLPEGFLFE